MDRRTFNDFRKLVYDRTGINLHEGKESLLCARVAKRMRALNVDDYKKYFRKVVEDESGNELVLLIDAISTNVTSFFREPAHFDFLKQEVEKWVSNGENRLRIWSAACSSGEEPYSIAITLREALQNRSADVKILATDISTRVLKLSKEAIYKEEKLKPVSAFIKDRYFEKTKEQDAIYYSAKKELRKDVVFSRINLSIPPFPMKGPFDVIFCRNVMIYFDNHVRMRLLDELYRLVKPGGYLIVGHAESLTGMMSKFQSVKPAIYIKKA